MTILMAPEVPSSHRHQRSRRRKTDQIRTAWATGDQIGALRIAARFFDRSADTKAFKRGMDAYNNPNFYRQLGNDPAQLTAAALSYCLKNLAFSPR